MEGFQLGAGVEITYSPSSVLNLFNNALQVQQSRKLIRLKGIYLPGKGANYNGFFYDTIRDESMDAQMTLLVPALVRNELKPEKTIHFWGYISRRVVNNGGRIEVQIVLSELLEQTGNRYSERDVEMVTLQQEKATLGYRDVTSFIKKRIQEEKQVTVQILIGNSAIIDSDIRHQLKGCLEFYEISFRRINLNSEQEIISSVKSCRADIAVIARGGGENLDIFNRPSIAAACLNLQPFFITAIGHAEDVTLVQKIADKAFTVPAELGQYLDDLYNRTKEELEHSKAKLVSSITAQIQAGYEQKVSNLMQKIKDLEDLSARGAEQLQSGFAMKERLLAEELESLKRHHEQQLLSAAALNRQKISALEDRLENGKQAAALRLIMLILALLGGFIIGWFFRG